MHGDWLDELAVGVVALDANGCVLDLNLRAEALLNTSRKRARGQPLAAVLGAELKWRERLLKALLERHRVILLDQPFAQRRIDVRLSPLPPAQRIAWLLEMSVRASDESTDDADKQRALLRAVGHEVKNPLGGMRGAAQLLARENLSEDGRELTQLIEREVDRLSALIDRWGETKACTHLRVINLHEAMEHVHRLMAAELRGRVAISRDYDVSLPSARADLNRLIQALINLLRNAEQAGASRIILRTRMEDAKVPASARLSVIDNGAGVPEELLPRIFEPLVTGRGEGLGLGLSIVSAVAHEHGGRVELNSQMGATEFALVLPLLP